MQNVLSCIAFNLTGDIGRSLLTQPAQSVDAPSKFRPHLSPPIQVWGEVMDVVCALPAITLRLQLMDVVERNGLLSPPHTNALCLHPNPALS